MGRASIVRFHTAGNGRLLKERTRLKSFLINLFKKEGQALNSIDYIFCSDSELLEINKHFLHHDDLTDIITFNLSDNSKIVGEIYISVDRVKENAFDLGLHPYLELHRVIFHGALHLCGYNDKSEDEKIVMRNKEDENLSAYLK